MSPPPCSKTPQLLQPDRGEPGGGGGRRGVWPGLRQNQVLRQGDPAQVL